MTHIYYDRKQERYFIFSGLDPDEILDGIEAMDGDIFDSDDLGFCGEATQILAELVPALNAHLAAQNAKLNPVEENDPNDTLDWTHKDDESLYNNLGAPDDGDL